MADVSLGAGLGVFSPGYFAPVAGGDISPTGESILTFPQMDSNLDYAGVNSYPVQDGSTGDSTDTSSLWSSIGGIAGTFLRAFTGGQGVTVGGQVGAPKPVAQPVATSAVSSEVLLMVGALVVVLILFVALRK